MSITATDQGYEMTATDLTESDLIRIRHLVEDHAGNHFGGPMHLDRDAAVRYTTDVVENTLPDLGTSYSALWGLVDEMISNDPALLDRKTTEKDRVAAVLRRHAAAQAWMDEANEALMAADPWSPQRGNYDDGDPHPYAVACVDAAEREYPDMPALDLVRETIAKRWTRWHARRFTSRALRLVQAGSQKLALEVLAAGQAEHPDALDWEKLDRRIRTYHHLEMN